MREGGHLKIRQDLNEVEKSFAILLRSNHLLLDVIFQRGFSNLTFVEEITIGILSTPYRATIRGVQLHPSIFEENLSCTN